MTNHEDILIATDTEPTLALIDRQEEEVFQAHYEKKSYAKWAIVALSLYGFMATQGLISLAKRPVQNRYIQMTATGEALERPYNDLLFSPNTVVAEHYLEQWATYRYQRLQATVGQDFSKNYLFLEKRLGLQMMAEDQKKNLVANVLANKAPENDIHLNGTQILQWGKRSFGTGVYTGGVALLDFHLTYQPTHNQPAFRKHMTVAVTFYLNPDQVDPNSRDSATYRKINPLGLTIVERPVENELNDARLIEAVQDANTKK